MSGKTTNKKERSSIKPGRKSVKKPIEVLLEEVPMEEDLDKQTEEVVEQKEEKKEKKPRSVNVSPASSSKNGLNIPVPRIRDLIACQVLNGDESRAISSLHIAQGREELIRITKDKKNGVEKPIVYKAIPQVPLSELGEEVHNILGRAHEEFRKNRKELYTRSKFSQWRKTSKELHAEVLGLRKEHPELKEDEIAIMVDPTFYDEFVVENRPREKDTEWGHAINLISKMRTRFSANSNVYLTAFIEYMITQIATNGTYNCIADGKKIIKLERALEIADGSSAKRFNLFPILLNFQSYRDIGTEYTSKFNIEFNHKLSINEIFREVKMDFARKYAENGAEFNEDLLKINVGKELKDFCVNVLIEIVLRIGKMLATEIEARGVKTVNDTIMMTVIRHLHNSAGVSFRHTGEFIRARAEIYSNATKKKKDVEEEVEEKEEVEE